VWLSKPGVPIETNFFEHVPPAQWIINGDAWRARRLEHRPSQYSKSAAATG